MSAASSACDHVRDWMLGTPPGTWVSMGVYSDGRCALMLRLRVAAAAAL